MDSPGKWYRSWRNRKWYSLGPFTVGDFVFRLLFYFFQCVILNLKSVAFVGENGACSGAPRKTKK